MKLMEAAGSSELKTISELSVRAGVGIHLRTSRDLPLPAVVIDFILRSLALAPHQATDQTICAWRPRNP
jgi:hypothetical protein